MNEKILSQRLQMVASYLPAGANFADIGSDHAYLPCYICLKDKNAYAIAGEINDGPYQSAIYTVQNLNLSNRIDVRKGDGLLVLKENEVDTVVIAGMGGGLISQILETGKMKLNGVKRIITQPNVDADTVRKWFFNNGYQLMAEQILEEDGHIYEVLVADKSDNHTVYNKESLEKEFLFGPFLLQEKNAAFRKKWEIEKQKKEHAVNQMKKAKEPDPIKINLFQSEINLIEEVLLDANR